jgi:hypothetical protein
VADGASSSHARGLHVEHVDVVDELRVVLRSRLPPNSTISPVVGA